MTPEAFKAARLALGLTQVELGEAFGLDIQDSPKKSRQCRTIQNWESTGPVHPLAALALEGLAARMTNDQEQAA